MLATGAYEQSLPVPGWTLPGVMTAGAAQILLKTSGLVGGGRVVLAGCGPLLWLLAELGVLLLLLQVGIFVLIFVLTLGVTAAHLRVKRWLQLDWRAWLTDQLMAFASSSTR